MSTDNRTVAVGMRNIVPLHLDIKIMFRQIVGGVILKFGFPLMGRTIQFLDAEGPGAQSLTNKFAKITSVKPRSATSGELIEITFQDPLTADGVEFMGLLLYPRHRWHGASALIFSPIAVYVATSVAVESVISVATISLKRVGYD